MHFVYFVVSQSHTQTLLCQPFRSKPGLDYRSLEFLFKHKISVVTGTCFADWKPYNWQILVKFIIEVRHGDKLNYMGLSRQVRCV